MKGGNWQLLLVCLVFVLPSSAQDVTGLRPLPGMYSSATLDHWKPILESRVNSLAGTIKSILIERRPELRQLIENVEIKLLRDSPSNDPLDYREDPQAQSLSIPLLSLKFLYDLEAASAWLASHDFESHIFLYVSALRYDPASAFPQARYLSPLEAFDIPRTDDLEVRFGGDEARLPFDLVFNELFDGTLIFILAHEFGHIIFSARANDPQLKNATSMQQEAYADAIALQLLVRSRYTLKGVELLFNYLTIWSPNAADFHSAEKYMDWVETSTHPTTDMRLWMMASQLEDPHKSFADLQLSEEEMGSMKAIAAELMTMSYGLGDLAANTQVRTRILSINPAGFVVHKKHTAANAGNEPRKAAPIPASSGYRFSVIRLPESSAQPAGEGQGINGSGQIVGSLQAGQVAFLYHRGHVESFRVQFADALSTWARGINNSGTIVGSFTSSTGKHGFLRRRSGAFERIDCPGASETSANGINDADQIVGSYTIGQDIHAFWFKQGVCTSVFVGGATFASLQHPHIVACGINDSGHIVGYGSDLTVGTNQSGFLHANGVNTVINVPGAKETVAQGINGKDAIVGYYNMDGYNHGFVYANGVFSTIDMPGAQHTRLRSINDSGVIVGDFAANGTSQVFIATPSATTPGSKRGKTQPTSSR